LVSSDDEEILRIAKKFGAEPLLRPKELASDSSLTLPVIVHAISSLGNTIKDYDYIALLQPTSPLRGATHIEQAYYMLLTNDATSIISVTRSTNSPLKSFVSKNGYLEGIVNDEYPFMRRQDLPTTYQANGAIYIVDIEEFLAKQSLLTAKTIPFEMDVESSLDIDTESDLEKARSLLKQ